MKFAEEWMEEIDTIRLEEWLHRVAHEFISKARGELSKMNFGDATKILLHAESEIRVIYNSIRVFNEGQQKKDSK